MSVVAQASDLRAIPELPVRRFSVDDYHRLIDSGIVGENERVELIEGWIVPKITHHPIHDGTIQIVAKRLLRLLPVGWDIRIQSAITTADSEPEPDLVVVRGDEQTYLQKHPAPADIGLLIEIADSSLDADRLQKLRLYACAGIPVYWIVNLVDRQVEVHSEPTGITTSGIDPTYRARAILRGNESVPFLLDPNAQASIRARDLLPA